MNQRPMLMSLVAVGLLLAAVPSASASGGSPTDAVRAVPWSHEHVDMTLSAEPLGDGGWLLEAQLRDRSAGAIGSHAVRFSATVAFLGIRPVVIGTVETDAGGTAQLTYRPTWNGTQRIVARAPFADGTTMSNEAVLEVSGARTPITALPARLPVVGSYAGPVAAFVALSIWGLLVLVLVRVVLGVARASATTGAAGGITGTAASETGLLGR